MVTLGGNDHRYNAFMSYTAAASLTKVRGAHTLKVGFEGRMLRVNVWEARSAGTFNFRAAETQGPNPTTASSTAGLRFRVVPARHRPAQRRADPELEERRRRTASTGRATRRTTGASTPRLTLNLGLRYDIDVPRTERYDRMNYFDPGRAAHRSRDRVAAFPDLKGGVVFVGVDGHSRYQYNWDTNNIAPRLGAVVSADPKTVVRAGLQPHLRPVEPGRAGHGRAVRVPHREPVGDVDRRHHAVQPAPRIRIRTASRPRRARRRGC